MIPGAEVEWVPKEPRWTQAGGEPGEPDLLAIIPGMRPLYLDVTVVKPQSGLPGAAVRDAEANKHRTYPTWVGGVRATMCDFHPVAMETFGRLGPDSAYILRKLAIRAAKDLDLDQAGEVRRWREILGLRLQLENADTLIRG